MLIPNAIIATNIEEVVQCSLACSTTEVQTTARNTTKIDNVVVGNTLTTTLTLLQPDPYVMIMKHSEVNLITQTAATRSRRRA